MLRPVLPAALDALLNMCTAFNASSEILGLVLENMTVVLSVSEWGETKVARLSCLHVPIPALVGLYILGDPSG